MSLKTGKNIKKRPEFWKNSRNGQPAVHCHLVDHIINKERQREVADQLGAIGQKEPVETVPTCQSYYTTGSLPEGPRKRSKSIIFRTAPTTSYRRHSTYCDLTVGLNNRCAIPRPSQKTLQLLRQYSLQFCRQADTP